MPPPFHAPGRLNPRSRWTFKVLALALGAIIGDFQSAIAEGVHEAPSVVWVGDAPLNAPSTSLEDVLEDGPELWDFDSLTDPAQYQQSVLPRVEAPSTPALSTTSQRAARQFAGAFGVSGVTSSTLAPAAMPSGSFVAGQESLVRATTDAGDLLGSTPAVLNLGLQRRNPIVTDPRVRGSRVGSLAASGSYWVPARIDLDTATSKIDSRIVDHMVVIPGPYTTLWGPGFDFIDFQLLRAPRYQNGFEAHGQTAVDYKTNGENWYGRQSAWGGAADWGFRMGYGQSTGNDYDSGDGTQIPSSFKSRDVDAALGAELTDNSSIDANYLRLDQTDIELPGQAFDIDFLFTDGYELAYVLRDQAAFDRFIFESWYNRTVFEGSAQRPGKRRIFPFYDIIEFTGFTDVDSMSTGYRSAFSWDGVDGERLTAGADLRYVKQELNEITSGRIGFNAFTDANSPIPRSHSSNPGLFTELTAPLAETGTVTVGARADWVSMNVEEEDAELAAVGTRMQPAVDILGSDEFDQDELLGATFLSVDWPVGGPWTVGGSAGYAERAPNLTERYAIEPFMFLIQNGLNTVTGDPLLDKERLCQVDLRLRADQDDWRGGVTAFHAWAFDYITFESMKTVTGPPLGQVEQVNLKYVNTELATLTGVEFLSECDLTDWLIPFATVKYVQGDDRTRNGDFATRQATAALPTEQVAGLPRGSFSGIPGGEKEPLPGILPLESRIGVRLADPNQSSRWGLELYARVVDSQDRVALSLLETPTPGFTVWDVRTYVRPQENLMLVAGVLNFTDHNYREHLDFRSQNGTTILQPGVNFYSGAELTY
jgi:iron complex outermembrane recepter protein